MQQAIQDSSEVLVRRYQELVDSGRNRRLLVGVTGGPGSGKSELAVSIARKVNESCGKDICRVVGMDGWHYSRAELDKFPDPADAHLRRGAHDTFDAAAYLEFIKALKASTGEIVKAPSFSHAVKDPVPNDVTVAPEHEIILIEGLYVALDIEPWATAARHLDERWVVTLDEKLAEERIWRRHVVSGICDGEESARARAVNNDIPNGRFLLTHLVDTTRVIQSVDDPIYAPKASTIQEEVL